MRPPTPTPAPWINQPLALYHGTLLHNAKAILAGGVNVALGRPRTDFGRGFYTTTAEQQARAWAWRLSQRAAGSFPAVLRFDVDREALAGLEALWFVRGGFDADDYWSLVFECRRGGSHNRAGGGWYDAVIGPVAASWRSRLMLPDSDQISFHTPGSALLLNRSAPRILP